MSININVEKLQYIRISKGYTMSGLAKKAGISKYSVSQVENQNVNPRPDTIRKICLALDIEFEDICDVNFKKVQ